MTDRFQTLSTISSHGNVTLFRGWDSSQSRDVVIERIRLPQEIAQGFTRYARLLYGLRDPNLVRVLDFGADTEGAYLVMEALKGKTLEATVAAHALDMAAFRALVQQTLHGLAAAHESGLLHLQLRPEKIIMPWGSGDSARCEQFTNIGAVFVDRKRQDFHLRAGPFDLSCRLRAIKLRH